MTKEIKMTSDQRTKEPSHRIASFGLRDSFVIRHSSFLIFSAARLVLVLMLVLCLSCSSKRITKANVDQVTEGMSKKQVESILGPPTSLTTDDFVIMKKTTYVYRQGKDTVTIVFKDDKVQSKDSTLSN
ncbi:MAG TPA: outer membrane protein assembly factor BamE [Candidatus Udaeobacter sp.]|jgi:outer membrane protein assembly factor BamE (lipoprotein component of BamABCDE complex)